MSPSPFVSFAALAMMLTAACATTPASLPTGDAADPSGAVVDYESRPNRLESSAINTLPAAADSAHDHHHHRRDHQPKAREHEHGHHHPEPSKQSPESKNSHGGHRAR